MNICVVLLQNKKVKTNISLLNGYNEGAMQLLSFVFFDWRIPKRVVLYFYVVAKSLNLFQ